MPRLIDPGDGDTIDLPELFATLDESRIDVRDEDAFASLGPALARLGRNPRFLADLAIAELEDRCAGQRGANGYGAQVFLLRPPDGRFVVRANFWPAHEDAVLRASGPEAFFYGLPHDHNFPFLTWGYLGPGYWSDYYEVDPEATVGLVGEPAGLRFVERSRLEPGKLLLYRMRRDVHAQAPPDSFSVSLNILGHDPAQIWCDQFRYDLSAGTISGCLTSSPAEPLLALAVHCTPGGMQVALDLARGHPCARMRTTALDAIASADPLLGERVLVHAADDPDPRVAGHARRWLAACEMPPKRSDLSAVSPIPA